MDVHAPQTGDQVHRDEDCTERGELGEHVVDLVVRVRHLDRDLGEVVRVRSGEDLLVVVQVLGHRDQVVLDVGQVQSLHARSDVRGFDRFEEGRGRGARTMSEVGATRQFSLHRLARPLTTSALLPMSRRRPITFFRHVPMLMATWFVERTLPA